MTNVQLDDFRIQAWKKSIMICQKAVWHESETLVVTSHFPSCRNQLEPLFWAMNGSTGSTWSKKLSHFLQFQVVIKHRIYKFLKNLSCQKKHATFRGGKGFFFCWLDMHQSTGFSNASERWFASRFSWKPSRCNSDGWRKGSRGFWRWSKGGPSKWLQRCNSFLALVIVRHVDC